MSEPLFRYVRPAFGGLGTNEQADSRVKDELRAIRKLLARGFHDIDDVNNQQQYRALKEKLARLEDEDQNGVRAAAWHEEEASNGLGDLEKRWSSVQMELMTLKEQVAQYRPQPKPGAGEDTPELKALKKALDAKRREVTAINKELADAETALQEAQQQYEVLRNTVEADLVEVKRKLRERQQAGGNEGKSELQALAVGAVVGGRTAPRTIAKGESSPLTLKEQLALLEDEERNGINRAARQEKQAIRLLGDAKKRHAQVQSDLTLAEEKVVQYKRPPLPRQGDPILEALVKALAAKETEANSLSNEYVDAKTLFRNAQQDYQTTFDIVRSDQEEAREQLKELRRQQMPADYGDRFDLYKLAKDDVAEGRTSFSRKIGGDPTLQGLFVVVEDRIDKGRLPFNVALFFAESDLLRLAFLRAYYLDGLRDADAIAERVVDEKDGGAKHVYDFIVEKAVRRAVRDRKLS